MKKEINRRKFVEVRPLLPQHFNSSQARPGRKQYIAPSDKITLAYIGVRHTGYPGIAASSASYPIPGRRRLRPQ